MPMIIPLLLGWGKSALSAAISFFSKPPGTYIGLAIIFAAALWWFGQHEFNKGIASVKAENAKAATQIIDRQSRITLHISQQFDAVKMADQQATEKRAKEVVIHVTPKDDSACPIPLGFVRVFNGAAHGSVPPAAAGPDDTPTPVTLSEVDQATVENDGLYDQVSDQLKALQDWVRQQQAADPK